MWRGGASRFLIRHTWPADLVVALHAGISATSTAADVPRVTTAEYR